MKSTNPTASLVLSGKTLKIRGEGPIAASFNKDMVRRLFALPNVEAFHGPMNGTGFLSTSILQRLTKQAHASMLEVINSDPELSMEYGHRCRNYAAYANPSSGRWPPSDGLMVLEAIPVDLPFLLAITWFLDGSVRLSVMNGLETLEFSEVEFSEAYGKTYKEYCEDQLPLAIEKCQRALSLIAVDEPKRAVVTYINRKSEVEKKTMVFWQSDQIDQYLRRHELSHIATDPE